MKNILIINFRKFGDIFYYLSLITPLKQKYPDSSFYFLSFKETSKAGLITTNIEKVFEIDRKKICTLNIGGPFAIAHSIAELQNEIDQIDIKFDLIINTSHCHFSAVITRILVDKSGCQFDGITININGDVNFSSDWHEWFNEAVNVSNALPFSQIETFYKSLNLQYTSPSLDIAPNEYHQSVLTLIENLSKEHPSKKIIPIQFTAGENEKSFPIELASEIIELFHRSNSFLPVVISSHSNQDRSYYGNLSKSIKNDILLLECDFSTAAVLMKKCGIVITSDTSIKHLARLVSAKVIEVHFSEKYIFKMPAIGETFIICQKNENTKSTKSSEELFSAIESICLERPLKREFSFFNTYYKSSNDKLISLYFNDEATEKKLKSIQYSKLVTSLTLSKQSNKNISPLAKPLIKEYQTVLSDILTVYRTLIENRTLDETFFSRFLEADQDILIHPFKLIAKLRFLNLIRSMGADANINRRLTIEACINLKDEMIEIKKLIINSVKEHKKRINRLEQNSI